MRGIHAIGYAILERQYMARPECVHDARGTGGDYVLVHLRAFIAALGCVGRVHSCIENRSLWHDGDMVGCHGCIDGPTIIFYLVMLYSIINPLKEFSKASYILLSHREKSH